MDITALRQKAFKAFRYGDYQLAIQIQVRVYNHAQRTYNDAKALALFLISYGDFEGGLKILQETERQYPDHNDVEIPENIALCEMRCQRPERAIPYFEMALGFDPNKPNIHDGLAEAYSRIGNTEKSRIHGEESLRQKDQQNTSDPLLDLTDVPVPPFNPGNKKANIISFSLWGDKTLYTDGAIANVREAATLYPDWTCRFYVDETVPQNILQELQKHGAQIAVMEKPNHPNIGLFWRFLVCNDADVERYLIRDADSLVSSKEQAAVKDWLSSDKHFHMMRDFPTHSELILAGLWGGVTGGLPPLMPLIKDYVLHNDPNRTLDQQFLRHIVWPTFKSSCLIHDSIHHLENTQAFPDGASLPEGCHVGQRHTHMKK